jgi:hypothetical protein
MPKRRDIGIAEVLFEESLSESGVLGIIPVGGLLGHNKSPLRQGRGELSHNLTKFRVF